MGEHDHIYGLAVSYGEAIGTVLLDRNVREVTRYQGAENMVKPCPAQWLVAAQPMLTADIETDKDVLRSHAHRSGRG